MNTTFEKELLIGYDYQKRAVRVTIKVQQDEAHVVETTAHQITMQTQRLSITGYARRRVDSDSAYGGQIYDSLGPDNIRTYVMPRAQVERLVRVWKKYHLNDHVPGCVHQHIGNYSDPEIAGQVCPVTGYKYGHKWLYRPIPRIIDYIQKAF